MDYGLRDKVIVITGGSAGIGLATARLLLNEGARVAICARGEARLEAAAAELCALPGARVYARTCNVLAPDEVVAFVDAAAAALGGVDIAVCNAGLRRQTPFLDMPFAEWREILSVALDGAFLVTRAVAPRMARRSGGAIVGLSGVSTHLGVPNRAHVSAS